MKRTTLIIISLVFGLAITGISIWRVNIPYETLAQEDLVEEAGVESTAAEQEVLEEKDYPLPYPGILPDHPLYFLKMIRDRIQLWFQRDPVSRAKLLLHYADKRIAAALALAEKEKSGLAVSTATKAEKYLERVVDELKVAETESKDTDEFYETVQRSAIKHEMVLSGIQSRIPSEASDGLKGAMETRRQVHERLIGIKGRELEGEVKEDVETEATESAESEDVEIEEESEEESSGEE